MKLHGLDVTEQLQHYKDNPKVFHTLGHKPVSGAVLFIKGPINTALVLSYNATLSVDGLDVYNVCLGEVNGLTIGYLFYSPLQMRSDFFYLTFYRHGVNTEELKSNPLQKRLVSEHLVIHSNAVAHYLTVRNVSTPLTRFLSKE